MSENFIVTNYAVKDLKTCWLPEVNEHSNYESPKKAEKDTVEDA